MNKKKLLIPVLTACMLISAGIGVSTSAPYSGAQMIASAAEIGAEPDLKIVDSKIKNIEKYEQKDGVWVFQGDNTSTSNAEIRFATKESADPANKVYTAVPVTSFSFEYMIKNDTEATVADVEGAKYIVQELAADATYPLMVPEIIDDGEWHTLTITMETPLVNNKMEQTGTFADVSDKFAGFILKMGDLNGEVQIKNISYTKKVSYAYSATVGADAMNHNATDNNGMYFRAAPNGAYTATDWANHYDATSAAVITRIRDGQTTEVGTNVQLIKYNQTGSLSEYYLKNIQFQTGDVFILNGDFVDTAKNSIITFDNVRLKIAGEIDGKLRTVVDAGTEYKVGKIYKNWVSAKDNKETGFYFETPKNDAAYNDNWSVAYMPDLASNVQLTRGGVTYDVGKYDYSGGVFKKLGEGSYYFDTGAYLNANFPMQEGDVLTIQGTFRNSTCSITIEKTNVTYKNGNYEFDSATVYQVGKMVSHENGAGFGKDGNGNYSGVHFSFKETNDAAFNSDWTYEYKATSNAYVKLTRDGETKDIMNVGKPYIVKFTANGYYLKWDNWLIGSEAYPIREGDIITIGGQFALNGDVLEVEESSVEVFMNSPFFYAEGEKPSVVQLGYALTGTQGARTFAMEKNEAPYSEDWLTDYKPTTVDAVKLIRGDQTYNIGVVGKRTIIKFGEVDYSIEGFDKSEIGDLQAGDILVLDGQFYNKAMIIDIPASYFAVNAEQKLTSMNPKYVFKNEDGSVISAGQVQEYGSKATVPTDPTKAADAAYTYEFAGWFVDGVAFDAEKAYTGETVITAKFNKTAINYTATITKIDGTTATVTFNTDNKADKFAEIKAMLPASTAEYSYAWSATMPDALALENVSFTMVKTAVEYTATVVKADETTVDVKFTVENAAEKFVEIKAMLPASTAEYTYAWSAAMPDALALENVQFKVVATAVEYTITFAGCEGVNAITFTVETMATVEFPAVPAKAGYTAKWDKTAADVTLADITVNAVYEVIEYTATIVGVGAENVEVKFTVENAAEKFAEIKAMLPADTEEFTYAWAETMPEELALADVTFTVVATEVEDEQPEPEQPGTGEDPSDEPEAPAAGGCGSSIVGIGAAVTLLGAAVVVTMKKKEE